MLLAALEAFQSPFGILGLCLDEYHVFASLMAFLVNRFMRLPLKEKGEKVKQSLEDIENLMNSMKS